MLKIKMLKIIIDQEPKWMKIFFLIFKKIIKTNRFSHLEDF